MEIILKNFKRNELEITNPIRVGDVIIAKSIFYSFDIFSSDGNLYYGELSALPLFYNNYSPEKLECLSLTIDPSNIDLTLPFFNMTTINMPLDKNEVFAVEQFLLSYIVYHDLAELKFLPKKEINLLYEKGREYKNSKVKIKIGRQDTHIEKELLSTLSKDNILRLDGNRMLNEYKLSELIKDLDRNRIEYIEEPFPSIQDWNNSTLSHQYKFAIDENYQDYKNNLSAINSLHSVIAKPNFNISISELFRLLFNDVQIVISSSFESYYSLNTLINIASLSSSEAGLDTLDKLKMHQDKLFIKDNFIHGFTLTPFFA